MDNPEVTTYEVVWSLPGSDAQHTSRVAIIEGYSTVEDIPKIIAVKRSGNPAHAMYITIVSAVPVS